MNACVCIICDKTGMLQRHEGEHTNEQASGKIERVQWKVKYPNKN